MNNFLNTVNNSVRSFAKEEEGAQIVEYALIIATISIALIVLMAPLKTNFGAWVTRVTTCLTAGSTCA